MTTSPQEPDSLPWPPLPYLGLRRFEATDARLYSGRSADIDRCRFLLFSSSVRVLVLQGLSGSGKSSFLRAGLIPAIAGQRRSEHGGVVSVGPTVNAGPDMLRQIARQVHAFVIGGSGQDMWEGQAGELKAEHPETEAFAASVGDDIEVLLDFLGKLNRSPSYEFVIAIDQVEDLWSVPDLLEKPKLHNDFFALVNEFAEERLNGKLVLTLRTERYGVFASRLPGATTPAFHYGGVNRLCHHYLANPSREELVAFVKRPLEPENPYGFRLEKGLAETIVDEIQQLVDDERSEMCVLPLLQVLLARLYVEGRDRAGDRPFEVTQAMYRELPIESRSSVGILDAHVRWGVARAVAQASTDTGGLARSLVSQRIESARWRTVLKKLAGTSVGGGRVSLRKSRTELESLANDAACELPLDRMLESLAGQEISLLAIAGDGHSLTLQHDLLGMTFDPGGMQTPHTWQQRVRERRRRIARAIDYTADELFGNAPPQRQLLRVAELRFWDHKLLSYADKLRLFDRLGFDVQRVNCDKNVTAEELAALLANVPSTEAVYSFPRELMSDEERRASTELVVLNLFTGFAIVCNRAAHLPSAGDDLTWERFDACLQSMLALRDPPPLYLAEDELAKDFFLQALDIARLRLGASAHEVIDQLASSVKIDAAAGAALVERIIESVQPCIAIVTAPTWAVAKMVEGDIATLMDQQGLLDLLHQPSDFPPDAVHRFRRGLLVHNVMSIQWPRSRQWVGGEDEPVLLRLASVGLFLADCLWANDEAAGLWIRERWNRTPALAGEDITTVSPDVFLSTFRRAYRYAPSSEYSECYFESDWPEECPTALHVYRRLMELRLDFHQLCADTTSNIRGGGECTPDDVADLIERAHRHAAICNYFDAWRLTKMASDRLAGGSAQ